MLQELLMKWLVTTGCHKLPVILFLLAVVVLVEEAVEIPKESKQKKSECGDKRNYKSVFISCEI